MVKPFVKRRGWPAFVAMIRAVYRGVVEALAALVIDDYDV